MPFEKGKSGKPGGRPKEAAEVKALARSHCVAAIENRGAIENNAKRDRDGSITRPMSEREIRSGEELERDGRGQFLPGASGNPAGPPPGRRDKRVNAREELLGPIAAAIEKLAAAITQGEKWAIELVVEYSLRKRDGSG